MVLEVIEMIDRDYGPWISMTQLWLPQNGLSINDNCRDYQNNHFVFSNLLADQTQ